MADCSMMCSGTASALLADSSVCDSRMMETTRDQAFLSLACEEDGGEMLPKVETRVVLVGEAGRNDALLKALEAIRVMEVPEVKIREGEAGSEEKMIKSIVPMEIKAPVIKTDDVQGFEDGTDYETVFVLPDFNSADYSYLYKQEQRIVGPPFVLHCAAKEEPLHFSCRPIYCTAMLTLTLCFTGFRNKEKLVNLVHHMGGTIRKDFSTKVTHLVACSTNGEKYRLAVCLGTPIVCPSWIEEAWERRDDVHFHASQEDFRSEFKVPPFQNCVLCFLGFSEEEKANMQERTLKHGGGHAELGDEQCTHMVVEENSVKDLPAPPSKALYVVKQEWFWGSIQMDARADESMYLYEKNDSPAMKKAVSLLSLATPSSNRKRRRLRDTLAQLTKETGMSPFPPRKRPSAEHSLSSGSLLDISNTPETCKALGESSTPAVSKQSARWQVSKELCQTESNYVDILNTILQLFKHPLEKEGQLGGPILAPEEIKTIFGSIPEIYEVHTKIEHDLEELLTDWSEGRSVGDIFLKYVTSRLSAFPPSISHLMIDPAKHLILLFNQQINQAKPECGRQTLAELLIRPVQRLPSVALLLNDIKKHTSDDNPDKITLERAIESLKEVMTHINEDKRKTEGQKQIFDVVYEVDGCPANLLSSHRTLVLRVETIALGDEPCDRGENVTLFLFNDCLEIARKRHKVMKGPLGQTRPPPPLKHIALMPLSQIRRVLDLQDTEECVNAFALVVRPPTEQENLLFSFQLAGEATVKSDWLRLLCRHVANTICRADSEDLIHCIEPDKLQVSTKDMGSTLSKASRAIKKTSKKVTRAFSFTKTPKRVIQRAFLANTPPDEKTPRLSCESRACSSATLAMPRSASTFSLTESTRNSTVVHRSNSLDHPPLKARIPVCIRTPCTPAKRPSSHMFSESSKGPDPVNIKENKSSSIIPPPPQKPALSAAASSPQLSDIQDVCRPLLPGAAAPQTVHMKTRSFTDWVRDPQTEPCSAVPASPHRETLI
uniref:Epithelial cell transforming 2 n=1 Tax=Cyprinodon variegatus TaxID=28743 RepID=A0A3Q2E2E8_CYPVA